MIQGIDHVALNVKNLDEAVEFYTQILGLKVTQREYSKPGLEYFLDAGSALIGLIQGNPEGSQPHPFAQEGIGANHLSFRVKTKDFDAMLQKLQNAKVEIMFAKKREKSWSMYFKDMDGNKLEMTAWPHED